jgi:NAD(P)H-dependent FMN reductase
MARLVGISGSLRKGSYNTALLRAAAGLVPDGSTLDMRTLHGVPLYNGDDEATTGIPPSVQALKDAITGADGVLLFTPEYNNSIPGVFKNAFDWISRPPADLKRTFAGRPFGILGASSGGFGTILSQVAWLPVLRHVGANIWTGGRLQVSKSNTIFDQDGGLTDDHIREQLRTYLAGFVAYVDKR